MDSRTTTPDRTLFRSEFTDAYQDQRRRALWAFVGIPLAWGVWITLKTPLRF